MKQSVLYKYGYGFEKDHSQRSHSWKSILFSEHGLVGTKDDTKGHDLGGGPQSENEPLVSSEYGNSVPEGLCGPKHPRLQKDLILEKVISADVVINQQCLCSLIDHEQY